MHDECMKPFSNSKDKKPQLRMGPVAPANKFKDSSLPKKPDAVGIRFAGPVMTDEKSLYQVRREDAVRAADPQPSGPQRQYYKRTEDYDPVLRFHCRLDDPQQKR
jgi:hypothetical protein